MLGFRSNLKISIVLVNLENNEISNKLNYNCYILVLTYLIKLETIKLKANDV